MASVVMGIGTSHGPMLSTAPERWFDRVAFDRAITHHFRGAEYSFDELVDLRKAEPIAPQLEATVLRERYEGCRSAIDELASRLAEVRPDRIVIFGNDQMEVFCGENQPAFLVHWGAELPNIPSTAEQRERFSPGMAQAEHGHHGTQTVVYPGDARFGRHVIDHLIEDGFDVAVSNEIPEIPQSRLSGIPHAFGFVYRQLLRELTVPALAIFTNTFYPPNQPTVRRCYDFGAAVSRAIGAWPGNERIALVGSGGLSHFVVDEDLDRGLLDALQANDSVAIRSLPESSMRAGTSELKNWVSLAAGVIDHGLTLSFKQYFPCYRSLAGTGNGLAFAYWL